MLSLTQSGDALCGVADVFLALINTAQVVLLAWLANRAYTKDQKSRRGKGRRRFRK